MYFLQRHSLALKLIMYENSKYFLSHKVLDPNMSLLCLVTYLRVTPRTLELIFF